MKKEMKKEMILKEIIFEFNNILIDLAEMNIAHDFKAVKKFDTITLGIKQLSKIQEIRRIANIQKV